MAAKPIYEAFVRRIFGRNESISTSEFRRKIGICLGIRREDWQRVLDELERERLVKREESKDRVRMEWDGHRFRW